MSLEMFAQLERRRIKRVRVSSLVLLAICKQTPEGGCWVTWEGLPAETELVNVHYSPEKDEFVLTVSHPSFPEVKAGGHVSEAIVCVGGYDMGPKSATVFTVKEGER